MQIGSLTEVVVRARLSATTQSCETYCSAKARHVAEGECGSEPGATTCRSTTEADYSASCTTECTASSTYAPVVLTKPESLGNVVLVPCPEAQVPCGSRRG